MKEVQDKRLVWCGCKENTECVQRIKKISRQVALLHRAHDIRVAERRRLLREQESCMW
jgi:hypothetical protein